MGVLNLHKQIEKKEYANSPVGKLERQMTAFYDDMKLSKKVLPEEVAKQIYDIRDENEKKHKEYIDYTLQRDKEAVDALLIDSFTRELEVINNWKKNADNI